MDISQFIKVVNGVGRIMHPDYGRSCYSPGGVKYSLVMDDDYSGIDAGVTDDYGIIDDSQPGEDGHEFLCVFQGGLGGCVNFLLENGWTGDVN